MLRNLIMGLVLANLLVLAWQRWVVAPDVADPSSYAGVTEPPLELIERRAAPVASTPSAARGARCFRLGAFSTAEAADAVAGRLAARGLPVTRSSEAGRIWVGHWVQLTALETVEAARRAVAMLSAGGIGDAYMTQTEPTIDVSLGVFRGRRGADRVIRLAQDMGYEPVTTDRFRDGVEHWVEVETPADQPLELAGLQAGLAQIVRIEEQTCATAVIDAEDGDAAIVEGAVANGDSSDDSLESSNRDDSGRAGKTVGVEPTTAPE